MRVTATRLALQGLLSPVHVRSGLGMADAALAEGAVALVDGLSDPQALAGSLLIRVATLWFGVVLGAVALLRLESVLDFSGAPHRHSPQEDAS